MKKVLLTTVMSLMMCMGVFAQDYLGNPKSDEKVIGLITVTAQEAKSDCNDNCVFEPGQWYMALLRKASEKYADKIVDIRNINFARPYNSDKKYWYGPVSGKVVSIGEGNPETQSMENLSKAMDKALRNVREGSRVAIDMVTVSGGVSINREDLKDQIIDALLDKGYKVVAKDYLEKMYEEQEAQQSGIYNENTTVKENNFSAVGYYINVKVTETSLRVQVVNVSTGEYEGNATVNF